MLGTGPSSYPGEEDADLINALKQTALGAGVKRVAVVMEHGSKNGDSKLKPRCSLRLTGGDVVDPLIPDLATFSGPTRKDSFRLIELAPGVSRKEEKRKSPATYTK